MAKVEKRKARKDYPEDGIKAGDEYYYVQMKTGQRSSKVMRSLNRDPAARPASRYVALGVHRGGASGHGGHHLRASG